MVSLSGISGNSGSIISNSASSFSAEDSKLNILPRHHGPPNIITFDSTTHESPITNDPPTPTNLDSTFDVIQSLENLTFITSGIHESISTLEANTIYSLSEQVKPTGANKNVTHSKVPVIDKHNSPLLMSILSRDVDELDRILKGGVTSSMLERTDNQGKTVFNVACMTGNIVCIQKLLEAGSDIETKSKLGRTGLHEAAIGGHHEVIELLMEHGFQDIDTEDNEGMTATHLSALHGETECLAVLFQLGCDASLEDHQGRMAAHLASMRGHVDTLRSLAERGFDLDGEDKQGKLPAHYAAEYGAIKCLELMSKLSVDLVSADNRGWEPIHQAACTDQLRSLKFFTNHGTKMTDRDNKGRSAVHIAALYCSITCLHWMLENEQSPNLMDDDGNTPLHLAASIGSSSAINCLIEHGGDVSIVNCSGLTALQIARRQGKQSHFESGVASRISCSFCNTLKSDNAIREAKRATGIHATIENAMSELCINRKTLEGEAFANKLSFGKPRMPEGHKLRPSSKNTDNIVQRDLAASYYGPL